MVVFSSFFFFRSKGVLLLLYTIFVLLFFFWIRPNIRLIIYTFYVHTCTYIELIYFTYLYVIPQTTSINVCCINLYKMHEVDHVRASLIQMLSVFVLFPLNIMWDMCLFVHIYIYLVVVLFVFVNPNRCQSYCLISL